MKTLFELNGFDCSTGSGSIDNHPVKYWPNNYTREDVYKQYVYDWHVI